MYAFDVWFLSRKQVSISPSVHPVPPIIGEGRLILFMEPTSPKGFDLRRDGRFALHAGVEDDSGGGGEFYIWGTAELVTDNERKQ